MRDKDLYAAILGIRLPWQVASVELLESTEEVRVRIEARPGTRFDCPRCGSRPCPGYDTRRRRWRHLDTCQFKTILEADVPRIECAEHGVVQVDVPWAEPGSGFTALMDALVIEWLKEASIQAVARRMRLSWSQVDGIMQRAVRRGLARRGPVAPKRIGVDETSFQKRHEYVTVVNDLDHGRVVWVADGRGQSALDGFYEGLTPRGRESIEAVAMDMWMPYICSTAIHVPQAEEKIAFDRFHVVKHLTDAVDQVRRHENRQLVSAGDDRLKRSKYLWLRRSQDLRGQQRLRFRDLKNSALKTARAWALKEAAVRIWGYTVRGWARRAWNAWLDWASRCRLEPMVKVAKMIRYHLIGILNADVLGVTNARAESLNAKIQKVKRMACGFRNRARFRNAILFHLGGLDLAPQAALTHTKS